jgi:pimeloyl-ACP methyl ester carboxylesterase
MFAPLVEVGFGGASHTVLSYPPDRVRSYDENLADIRSRLALLDGPFLVVAESYSGPLGIRLAADPVPGLAGVLLVATFATSPVPRFLRPMTRPAFFRSPPPRPIVRHFLTGWQTELELAEAVIHLRRTVTPEVYRHRVLDVLAVDVRAELRAARVPMVYLKPTRDRLVRTRRRGLLRLQPALRWVELDAPHMVLQTRPEEASRVICQHAAAVDR